MVKYNQHNGYDNSGNMSKAKTYKEIADKYADDVISGKIVAGAEVIAACKRYKKDLKRKDIELRERDPDVAINIIETTMVHAQGEDLKGNSLLGKPFLLEPWQIFIIYNLLGFWYVGENRRRYNEAFIEIGRKNGKALALTEELPTPDGWREMREISVGDYVFGKDGKPARVIVESEIFNKPMYRVAFEDGSTVKASADHIWTVQTKRSRATGRRTKKCADGRGHARRYDLEQRDGWFEMTTAEIATDYVRHRCDGKGAEFKYRVPMNEAVEYEAKDFPIDPYP